MTVHVLGAGATAPQSMMHDESPVQTSLQVGAVQVNVQVLPPPQLQVASAHSAVQTLAASQLASQGGVAQVKSQVAPSVQVHVSPQSPDVAVPVVVPAGVPAEVPLGVPLSVPDAVPLWVPALVPPEPPSAGT